MYSVVIAAGGRHELLAYCLDSVLDQTFEDYEVIVVDYGADPPLSVPDGVRLIRCEPEGGWSNPIATNTGVAHARGERLVIMNADIIISVDMLARVHDKMQKHGDCQLSWERFDLDPDGVSGRRHPAANRGDFLCIDRQRYMDAGGYDERMSGWGAYDTDLNWRLKQLGCREVRGMEPPILHQWHEPQPTKEADQHRNFQMHLHNVALRRLVVNEGAATFEKYR